MQVSLHSPAEQLPHNKVEKLVITLNWATCNIMSAAELVNTNDKIFSMLVI